MESDGFDWEYGNVAKCQKHGLSTWEIESLSHSRLLIGPDFKHSDREARFHAIGRTAKGRPIIVTFTWRVGANGRFIRPISARYMHSKEIRAYEKAVSALEQ